MTDTSSGLAGLPEQTATAAAALASLAEPAKAAADSIDQAFEAAGANLVRTLAKAASDGKLSLGELASAVIEAVDATARGGASGGGALADALASALSSAFGGARADGGPVSAGGAYLVGERGPEVFRPGTSGSIDAGGASGMQVNLNLAGASDPQTFVRSEAQIAQALARAVALGRR